MKFILTFIVLTATLTLKAQQKPLPRSGISVQADSGIRLPGQRIIFNADGFPRQLQSFFMAGNTGYSELPFNFLGEGIHFHCNNKTDGKDIKLQPGGIVWLRKNARNVAFEATSSSTLLQQQVRGSVDDDGFITYRVTLVAQQDVVLKNITYHIPFLPAAATYLDGLGQRRGLRPDSVRGAWHMLNKGRDDGAWIGGEGGGLRFSLRDEDYKRARKSVAARPQPPVPPAPWDNKGRGGIELWRKGTNILFNSFTGEWSMQKGDTLLYNFDLLITPFNPSPASPGRK